MQDNFVFSNIPEDFQHSQVVKYWLEQLKKFNIVINKKLETDKVVAQKLGIEFMDVVKKVKNNQQQKLMNNRFYQCNNLDGVFEIKGKIENKPVLLIDDIVDSGWTLTVISTLLKRSGSGPVFPVALATTSTGG